MSTEAWHGTPGGYTNHYCRCSECRRALRDYKRAYRDSHPERDRSSGRLLSPDSGTIRGQSMKRPGDAATSRGMATKRKP